MATRATIPVFDRVLAQLTHERYWAACEGCELARTCYAPHNARTFAHPSAGPTVTRRLRDLYRLVHLRGQLHITLRDLRSALAFMLTSGRDCAQIHELYRTGDAGEILTSFYFNSWLGTPDSADRLLRLLRELDVAAVPEPALDGKLAAIGPTAGQVMMTIDQRGTYDLDLLAAVFGLLRQDEPESGGEPGLASGYLDAARRRFYFECVDDKRARSALPFRSAERFLTWLARPGCTLDAQGCQSWWQRSTEARDCRTRRSSAATSRSPSVTSQVAASAVTGSSRGGRSRSLSVSATPSRYVETEPDSLELTATSQAGQVARLRMRLDLFELLQHQRDGYLPSVAELQGRYLELVIFKNELSATPYQEVLLTTDGRDAHRISREPGGRLVMTPLTQREEGRYA